MRQDELSEYACEEHTPPRVYEIDRAIVVELHGEIDLAGCRRIAPLIDAVASGPEPIVLVDLSEVHFFDCSGLTLLVRVHRRVSERGARFGVVCAHPLTLRILRLTHLIGLLRPAPTVGAALAALGEVTQRDA
ncbi:STAS domain-containing protein [Streptomyces sp. NPDC005898]|uniref:STAS domain-containing protein n=1 Tax=Streptomyces sp. NPDC005898 TaxID=3157082 RepID=UPI0033F5EC30